MAEPLSWENIDNYHQRAKVFGGWLVKAIEDVVHDTSQRGMVSGHDFRIAMCFIPDSRHEWEVETNEIRKLRAEEDNRLEKKNW